LLFLFDRWRRCQGRPRRIGSSLSKLASIVCIDGIAKADRRLGRCIACVFLTAVLLTGCARTAPPATSAPLPVAAAPAFVALPATASLPALVQAERTAARTRDAATLRQVWAADAQIIDRRGTLDPADDFVWRGRDAILDRYALAVFPAPPPPFAAPPILAMTIDDDVATAVLGADAWRFIFRDGRWWLQELAY
jgi:hypothetical protein